jgi:integrase
MSVYFVKGQGWRYDFTLKGRRYTRTWFATKSKAKKAEARRREDIEEPKIQTESQTDMDFLELVNRKLDHVKAYNSERHYADYFYMAKRWTQRWPHLTCSQATQDLIEHFVLERRKVSAFTANKEIRYLRAVFNFGLRRKLIKENPAAGVDFFPTEKRRRYVPTPQDIEKIISIADREDRDYIEVIRETMARVSEVNCLTWDEIDLDRRCVTLYTRKKKGGHLTPREVPMTARLLEILSRRHANRDRSKSWVFWHRYWSRRIGAMTDGPYGDRKKLMRRLCKKAGVKYFRFHPLRHSGASVMDNNGVPVGAIQRILGHENRKTTEIYLHGIGQTEREAMAVFERASRKNLTKVSHIN